MADMIPKGCTAVNTFTVPFTSAELSACYVTYSQGLKVVIEKSIGDFTISNGILTVYLKQEDTISLDSNTSIRIQIRARCTTGDVIKSNIINTTTDEILKRGII